MVYQNGYSGRVDDHPSMTGREQLGALFLTPDDVQEQLIEAKCLWRRTPDRERGWLHVRAYWPDVRRAEFIRIIGNELDWPEERPEARPLPLTRDEVAKRDATSEWLALVAERDRPLVVLAIACLAAGHKRVPWMRLKRQMGVRFGADGLRMRYQRALSTIAKAVNSAENRDGGVSS